MPENETDANETFDCYLNIYICVVCFDLVIFFLLRGLENIHYTLIIYYVSLTCALINVPNSIAFETIYDMKSCFFINTGGKNEKSRNIFFVIKST